VKPQCNNVLTTLLVFVTSSYIQGVNTPDSILQISCLTPKDRADLEYMLKIGVDWIALSFVQRPEDIVEITRLIMEHNPQNAARPHVMAKIEKPSCFDGDSLAKIVELCDGIMVARGDLGVECAPEDVPILQKQIIDECREQGKPVVVATQMLESMIESPTPTRAEASDVATAIYDGADAIMLSAESAAGDVSLSAQTVVAHACRSVYKPSFR
jgi:pyruvate kinase